MGASRAPACVTPFALPLLLVFAAPWALAQPASDRPDPRPMVTAQPATVKPLLEHSSGSAPTLRLSQAEITTLLRQTYPDVNGATVTVTPFLIGPTQPRDSNSPITDGLLAGFDPARLLGLTPPLPSSLATIPADIVTTLPHYGGHGCED